MDGYISANIFTEYRGMMISVFNYIYAFHMPLFFVLSGSVCACAYLTSELQVPDNNRERFTRNCINLVMLYFEWATIFWLFKMVFSGEVNSDVNFYTLLLLPIKALSPYWYLYILGFCYLLLWFWQRGNLMTARSTLLLGGGCSLLYCVLDSACEMADIMTIRMIFPYFFFFFLGVILYKYRERISNVKMLPAILGLIITVVSLVVMNAAVWCNTEQGYVKSGWTKHSIMGFLLAFVLSFLIYVIGNKLGNKAKVLPVLGRYSLEIYVIHCIITAGNRVILPKLGINEFWINVSVNSICAVGIPILISMVLKRLKIYDVFFRPVNCFVRKKR